MGVFSSKKEDHAFEFGRLNAENEQLKLQVKDKDKRIAEQQEQITRLQDGIMAVQAPEAYSHMKDMEYANNFDSNQVEPEGAAKKRADESEILNRYAQMQEQPLFSSGKDFDDMLSSFTVGAGAPEAGSQHGKDES